MKVAKFLLLAVLLLVTEFVWLFAFRFPFMNALAGPATGALAAIAVLVGYPARRGPKAQILAFVIYAASVLGTAGSYAAGILPWPHPSPPSLGKLLLFGAHGEGVIGIAAVCIGGVIAATAPGRTAQQADEADGPAAGTS